MYSAYEHWRIGIAAGMLFFAALMAAAGPVRVGFSRSEITPPVGSEMPGGFAKNLSKGVHDPLWAEAAVFLGDSTQIALVGVDLCMVPRGVVEAARAQISEQCRIPGVNVLIAASHTHNGGPVVDCFGSKADPAYVATVAERIAEAVKAAAEKAVVAKVGASVGREDSVGFNRRFKMKDGSVKTHPGKMNPDIVDAAGPIDPDVAVLAAINGEGELLGCVVNHALHGTTMSGSLTSADWPYYMRETIRAVWGREIGVVFLNGACGDVTQVDNRNPRPSEFGEAWSRRIGMTVGAEAVKELARMEYAEEVPLAVAIEEPVLSIRDLAESDEALVAREAPATGLGSGGNDVYLREAGLVRQMKVASPNVTAEIQAIRIGSAAIVSNPTEFFCALGLAIKNASPWKPTFVVELANGYLGYAPTAEAFQGGGYEVRTARSSYLEPGAGEAMATAAVQALNALLSK